MKQAKDKPIFEAIVAVASITGKVAKSTTANNLLTPRMPGAKLFRVETINVSGDAAGCNGVDVEIEYVRGDDSKKLLEGLSKVRSAVIDVGTSNVENFLLMLQQEGAQSMFDYFVVPCEAVYEKVNEFQEFCRTVNALAKLGVAPERIKVLFTKLKPGKNVEEEAIRVFNYHKQFPLYTLDRRATIHETPIFGALSRAKKRYEDFLLDETDYFLELKNISMDEPDRRELCVKLGRAKALVVGFEAEMENAFNVLFSNTGTMPKKEGLNLGNFSATEFD